MNARPPNCGTGYCSCIECIYGKDGCVADEEQCNDGCLARESVIANALKLADEIDAEFFQGRISNHSGRKAAQMLRMLVEAPVQPVKQEPVAIVDEIGKRLDGTYIFNAVGKVGVGQPLYAAPVSAPKQEPVAWAYFDADGTFMDALDRQHGAYQTPLHAEPVSAEAIRAEALEEAAKWCEAKQSYNAMHANTEFAAGIRGLK